MWRIKSVCSVLFLILTVAVLHTHFTSSLFPGIPAAFFIIGISGVYLAYNANSPREIYLSLSVIITTTTALGWFVYAFPASFIAFDPDLFAVWAKSIIQDGMISGIESGFYRNAPAGLLLPAMASVLTDTPIRTGFGIYSILLGILLPLLTISFASHIHTLTPRSLIGASTIAAVMALPIKLGYLPIAQNLSILVFQTLVLTLIINANKPTDRFSTLLPMIILIVTLSFTHKLPLILTLLVLIILFTHDYLQPLFLSIYNGGRSQRVIFTVLNFIVLIAWAAVAWYFTTFVLTVAGLIAGIGLSLVYFIEWDSFLSRSALPPSGHLSYFLLISFVGSLLLTQWVYQTLFAKSFLFHYIVSDQGGQGLSTRFTAAIPADPGMLDPFFHQSHALIQLLLAAIAFIWLIQSDRIQSDRVSVKILLATAGVVFLLSPFSILVQGSVGIGATRLIPNFSSVLAALIAIRIFAVPQLTNPKRIAAAVIIVFVIFQAFSVVVVPDYPGTYRSYLHQDEIDAKSFANKHTNGEITTDYWYATERVASLSGTYSDVNTTFNAETEGYTKGTLVSKGHKYILYRTDVDVYRFSAPGSWELIWEPSKYLNKSYSKTYTSGGADLYWAL